MSKLEIINKYIKNAKITNTQLKKICYCFAYDFTASHTAKKIGLSRQTINSYYKMIREYIIEEYDNITHLNFNNNFNKRCFHLQYINFRSQITYYIQHNGSFYILDNASKNFEKLIRFVHSEVHNSLINHRKSNTARILYHLKQDEYLLSTYLYSDNKLEDFIHNRLKKFRGLTKNNNILHIKESILRYNYDEKFLINVLSIITQKNP